MKWLAVNCSNAVVPEQMGRWWWGSSYGLAAQMQQPASFLEGAM